MPTIERMKAYQAPDGTTYEAPSIEVTLFSTPDGASFRSLDAAFSHVVCAWCSENLQWMPAAHARIIDLDREQLIALAHFILSLQPNEAK
jgi:hypothetical protein